MTEQDWLYPQTPQVTAPAISSTATRFELRPLNTGEVLDRTFSLYRANFWFFVGLSSIAAGVNVIGGILRLVTAHFTTGKAATTFQIANGVVALVQVLLYLGAYTQTQAATTAGVNALYLGETTSITIAIKQALQHWGRYLGIAFWQFWSAIWIPLLLVIPIASIVGLGIASLNWLAVVLGFGAFAGFIYGIIAFIRNSLGVPAAVIEDVRVRAAMARSKHLVAGRKFRIFLLLLLMYALYFLGGLIEVPIAMVLVTRTVQHLGGTELLQASVLIINFFVTSLVGPIAAIGFSLFYFDERVRREAFDIEFLLQATDRQAPPPPPAPAFETPAADLTTSEPV